MKSPREIVDERLARGEISAEEYSRLIEVLASSQQQENQPSQPEKQAKSALHVEAPTPPVHTTRPEPANKQSKAWLGWLFGVIGVLVVLMFLGVFNSKNNPKPLDPVIKPPDTSPFEAKFDIKLLGKIGGVKADDNVRNLLLNASPIDGIVNLDNRMRAESIQLPFYPGVSLIVVTQNWLPNNLILFFLYDGKTITRLNGKSEPIHKFNTTHPLVLNEETILPYLWYFGFFVRGEEGPFLIVNSPLAKEFQYNPNEIKFADSNKKVEDFRRPMTCRKNNKSKTYQCNALVVYANALFEAKFTVKPDGKVEMSEDKPLAKILSPKIELPISVSEVKSTFYQKTTSLEQSLDTDPNIHSHGGRTHTHPWPKNGVKHRHNNGPIGSKELPQKQLPDQSN